MTLCKSLSKYLRKKIVNNIYKKNCKNCIHASSQNTSHYLKCLKGGSINERECLLDQKLLDRKLLDQKLLDCKLLDQKLLDQKILDRKLLDLKLLCQKLLDQKLLDQKLLDRKQEIV